MEIYKWLTDKFDNQFNGIIMNILHLNLPPRDLFRRMYTSVRAFSSKKHG